MELEEASGAHMQKYGDSIGFCLQVISPEGLRAQLTEIMMIEFKEQAAGQKEGIVKVIAEETKGWTKKVTLVVFMDGVCVSKPSEEYVRIEAQVRMKVRELLKLTKEHLTDSISRSLI